MLEFILTHPLLFLPFGYFIVGTIAIITIAHWD
jgi:hypothetical protein